MAAGKSKVSKHITETHPNPHGEQDVAEMPLQTNHSDAMPQNVAGTASTKENRMNPSVTGPLEDPTDDSMFNNADPQTRELLQRESRRHKKTSKGRKVA
ncbi:MAG TPA: hypothetical protein VJA94_00355 [Candidatus Angelobacter sp.]